MDSTTAPLSSVSSLNSSMPLYTQTLALVAGLADLEHRDNTARNLAKHLGAEELMVFIRDPEVRILLPAPGFPQTLPRGRVWRSFLTACVQAGQHTAELPFPDAVTIKRATGFAAGERTVLVLLGGVVLLDEVKTVIILLPLLEAAFRGEQTVLTANAVAHMAHTAAEEAKTLTVALDGARGELQRTLAATDTIIEAIPDAIFVCDTQGQIVRVNANGAALLGLTLEQAHRPFNIYVLCNPEGTPVPREEFPLSQALRGNTRTDYRFMLRHRETGKQVQLLVSAAPIRNSRGEITGAVAVSSDITELYRLERQKDEFLSIASHELKTPLTTMKGVVQLTRRNLERAGLVEAKRMALIERAIARMERLIKDFLDISRIDADKLALRLERCDLADICTLAVEEQKAATNRDIHLELPGKPLGIEVDPERIGQVLTNLLSNALKYSQAESAVTLKLSEEAGQAIITIYDRGVGIPPEALPHLFERFYRVSGTQVVSGSEVGLGLGLYICRTIIERHHGQIGVQSLPGEGSTFWFTLPLNAVGRG